jgi:hypothetical protein
VTNCYLALIPIKSVKAALSDSWLAALPEETKPALLVSGVYVDGFLPLMKDWHFRRWALDSGAFSAMNSGIDVNLDWYMEIVKRCRDSARPPDEIFALDVIGDWREGLKNTEAMWKAGIEAIPCFHKGEPWDLLKGLARDYPKIALGGVAGHTERPQALRWVQECFARVWPKPIHGFGMLDDQIALYAPFASVDSSSWERGAGVYGVWFTYGRISTPSAGQNLRVEVEYMLAMEKRIKARWSAYNEKCELVRDDPTLHVEHARKRPSRAGRLKLTGGGPAGLQWHAKLRAQRAKEEA